MLCSAQLFGVEQPALAAQCLKAGENVYALAKSFTTCEVREKQLLTTAPFAFYPEVCWVAFVVFCCVFVVFLLLFIIHYSLVLVLVCADRVVQRYGVWRDGAAPGRRERCESVFVLRCCCVVVIFQTHVVILDCIRLCLCTGKDYLGDAAKWATMYLDTFDTAQPLNLYDVAAVAHLEVARSLSSAGGLRGQIVENLRGALSNALKVAATDPFGLAFDYQDGIDAGPMILVRFACLCRWLFVCCLSDYLIRFSSFLRCFSLFYSHMCAGSISDGQHLRRVDAGEHVQGLRAGPAQLRVRR